MKERPIIFNAEMVCAILEGRKNNTRRPMNPQPYIEWLPYSYGEVHKMRDGEFVLKQGAPVVIGWGASNYDGDAAYPCPYGQPGDRLWVRETFLVWHRFEYGEEAEIMKGILPKGEFLEDWAIGNFKNRIQYRASTDYETEEMVWRPAIHMPRWASRITLEITDIRAERLRKITGEDAYAEGFCKKEALIQELDLRAALHDFVETWDDIYAKSGFGWFANPWVWVIDFRMITP